MARLGAPQAACWTYANYCRSHQGAESFDGVY